MDSLIQCAFFAPVYELDYDDDGGDKRGDKGE